MLLLIDNYDSFTYNIVQYLSELGQDVLVKRNDEITCEEIEKLTPQYIVVGPGPCSPKEAGISIECIQRFTDKIPILGICLGHQSIGEAFGGKTIQAKEIMHGKNSWVHHKNIGIFENIPNPVNCTRYHSLVTDRNCLPECLEITAWTDDQEIMGIKHKTSAVEGVQFHPEALLTEHGYHMLNNFLVQNQ
ncbi:anthranilate/aminodeoxychorismate synthase component II [Neisseriaceae bacterium PsAf]|nr:anthranilate/aminodeoxychorismate synthase component II [Neisseriaceae bacterium PsAf]